MDKKDTSRHYLKDVSIRHPKMREPKVQDSLSCRKRKSQKSRDVSTKDSSLISDAVSSLNRVSNDEIFLSQFIRKHTNDSRTPVNENVPDKRKPSEANFNWLSSSFEEISFTHIQREDNFIVDSLAKLGHTLSFSQIWNRCLPLLALNAFNFDIFSSGCPRGLSL